MLRAEQHARGDGEHDAAQVVQGEEQLGAHAGWRTNMDVMRAVVLLSTPPMDSMWAASTLNMMKMCAAMLSSDMNKAITMNMMMPMMTLEQLNATERPMLGA